jgi:O-antigen/teichoic acid export membrane protein
MTRPAHQRPPAVASPAEAVRRLFGRGSVYTLLLAIQMLTAVLVLPVITRLLPPSAFGRVAAGLVVYSILSIVGAAGLPDAAARTFFLGKDGPREAGRLICAMTCIAVILGAVIDRTGSLWAPLFGLSYGGVLRLAVWGGAAAAVVAGTQSLLRVAERVWAYAGVALLAALSGQTIGVVLAALLRTGAAYMGGIAAGTVVAAAVGLVATGAFRAGLPEVSELKRGFVLGLPIVPHSLAVYMVASADRIVIAGVLGLAATGRYQVAYAVGSLGVALVTAINQAWLPVVLGAHAERRWEILTATSRVVYVVAAFVASALALAAPLGLLIAASASYSRASLVPVAAIVAFSAVPYATSGTYFQVVLVGGRTRVMAVAAPLAAVVNIGLNLVLLPAIGLVGAAVATVAAYVILPMVVALRARRMVALPEAFRGATYSWLFAAPFVAAGALLPSDAVGAVVRTALLIVAAAGALVLFRSVSRGSLALARLPADEPQTSDASEDLGSPVAVPSPGSGEPVSSVNR